MIGIMFENPYTYSLGARCGCELIGTMIAVSWEDTGRAMRATGSRARHASTQLDNFPRTTMDAGVPGRCFRGKHAPGEDEGGCCCDGTFTDGM